MKIFFRFFFQMISGYMIHLICNLILANKLSVVLSFLIEKGFSQCTLFGFPCCMNTVVNPVYDRNGFAYGFENGRSCVC